MIKKESLIKITNLRKSFGKEEVLKGIDILIKKGERVAVFGDNGSGKTTLLRCIIGLYRYEGKISVFGMNPRNQRSIIAEKTGYAPQLPPPISMSVSHLIDFAFDLSKKNREQVYNILNEIKFNENGVNRSFRKLSGGMQKKVLIAIALGREPELLIFDEPVAYIDPESRNIVATIINNLPQNTTIVYTSHASFREPEIIPTRIIEMDNGDIIKDILHEKGRGGK